MSVRATRWVWEQSTATGAGLLVLLCLADHADDAGVAWPSLTRLARLTRLSRRHVTRLLSRTLVPAGELARDGYVTRGPAPQRRYRLRMGADGDTSVPRDTQVPRDTHVTGVGTSAPRPRDTQVPPTVSDPSENHQGARASRSRSTTRARTSPRPAGDPRIGQAIGAFMEAHQAHVGTAYVPAHGRDGAALKRLLAGGYDLPALVGTLGAYFADRRSLDRMGASVPLWCGRVPTLAGRTARVNGTDLRDAADVLADQLGDEVAP